MSLGLMPFTPLTKSWLRSPLSGIAHGYTGHEALQEVVHAGGHFVAELFVGEHGHGSGHVVFGQGAIAGYHDISQLVYGSLEGDFGGLSGLPQGSSVGFHAYIRYGERIGWRGVSVAESEAAVGVCNRLDPASG